LCLRGEEKVHAGRKSCAGGAKKSCRRREKGNRAALRGFSGGKRAGKAKKTALFLVEKQEKG